MEFYISWSHSDPIYSNYFSNSNFLISPANVNANFNMTDWKKNPEHVLIDSSAYYYLSHNKKLPTQKEIFKKQINLINTIKCPVSICHLDNPINNDNQSQAKIYSRIERTLSNAYEFTYLFSKYNLNQNNKINKLGVIQGTNKLSIEFCANELKKMGFEKFGLGSLAQLYNPNEIISRIKIASEIVGGENLHIFGISRIDIIEKLNNLNVKSLDSTRPIMAAIYKGVFYSDPFKTYGIKAANNSSRYAQVLDEPLNCNCPVCQSNPNLILKLGSYRYKHARAIHNYYHLIKHLNKNNKIKVISQYN